jgi:hypothetical protein
MTQTSLVKTDVEGFSKDLKSGVIVANNFDRFKELKAEQRKIKEFSKLRGDIDALRSDLEILFTYLGLEH